MITVNKSNAVPITVVVGDPKIGEYMRAGGTLYRKSAEPGIVHIVPPHHSHAGAWREVCQ